MVSVFSKPHIIMATKLKEFSLSISLDGFLAEFWLDVVWYQKFLTEKLLDLSVEIEPWAVGVKPNIKKRNVKSFHPSKVSFPGLPSHAESLKSHELELFADEKRAVIKESNSFRGIPYAEYFSVNTIWTVKEMANSNCSIIIELDVVFHYSTWLSGTIRSNTSAELTDVFNIWEQFAEHTLQTKTALQNKKQISSKSGSIEEGVAVLSFSEGVCENSGATERIEDVYESETWKSGNDLYEKDDEDLTFYDCEEGGIQDDDDTAALLGTPQSQSSFFRTHSAAELHGIYSSNVGRRRAGEELPSTHSMAVNFVETVFVFAAFSFWQVHTFYNSELKRMFDVSPMEIFSRMINSFVPGMHASILKQPDLYGPIIAVLSLPQVLLLSLEVHRSGCSQASLLGNAVVVSLCLWIGLSLLYRVLAFFIAPTLDLKQCLSITGYSFFAWNVSLLFSYPIEAFQDVSYVPVALPLVIFGLPSAIAQGCMIWEYTPAAVSHLSSASNSSSSNNRFAYCKLFFVEMKNQLCGRIIWAIPKIIAFLVVSFTHYQFLWYVARVFLPGRRQICRLSAIVQPNQYADILTQKELRKYALLLLSGKYDE